MGYQERKRDFHEARWDEPIIMELGSPGERGVLVRHFDKDPIRDYNRITIGTPEQMDIFLEKLEELL